LEEVADFKSESAADFISESMADLHRNQQAPLRGWRYLPVPSPCRESRSPYVELCVSAGFNGQ
jgi:hypothetical protein